MPSLLADAPVDQSNPWADDKLDRKQVADHLTTILETVDGPLVVSVSAPFGMGKTFFARRWVADLNLRGKVAIYFNAWQTDFSENPLAAFVDAISSEIEQKQLPPKKKLALRNRLDSFVKAGAPALARIAAKVVLRAGSFVLLGEKVDDVVEAAVKGAADETEQIAAAQIEAFVAERKSREKFKKELAKLRDSLLSEIGESEDKKVYLIVDELDRCKPPYALEFLKSIKHLFDISGFIFILFVDDDQLNESATRLYGARTTGEKYLSKFINWNFRMPDPKYESYVKLKFGEALSSLKFKDPERFKELFVSTLSRFCTQKKFSLRAIEQAALHTEIAIRALGGKWLQLAVPMAIAMVVRMDDRQVYDHLTAQKMTLEQIKEYFGLIDSDRQFPWIVQYAADLNKIDQSSWPADIQKRMKQIAEGMSFDFDIDEHSPLGPVVRRFVEGSLEIYPLR